MIQDVIDYLD
jgi:hypothetical protein